MAFWRSIVLFYVVVSAGPGSAETPDVVWRPLISEEGGPGVYEPSAVRQLADGGLLLVQDESDDPFVLVRLYREGERISLQRPTLDPQDRPFWILGRAEPPRGLEDLEGLASGRDGYQYAITSHSRTESGARRKSRERLARLRIEGGRIRDYAVFHDLRQAILAAYPELKAGAGSAHGKGRESFNIEGLSSDREGGRLLIGLRAPILDGQSVILILENPAELFQYDAMAVFAPKPVLLDLDKGGIRALSYVPGLDSYLLVTQHAKRKGTSDRPFRLWIWRGRDDDPPRPLEIPGINLRKTEGITPVRHGGRDFLMLVSDDGDRARERPGHFLLLPLDALEPSRERQ